MKKTTVLLISGLLALCMSGCTTTPPTSTPSPSASASQEQKIVFDIEEYKSLVSACRANIQAAGIDVANVDKYIYNASKALGKISDSVDEAGFEWLEKNNGKTLEAVNTDYDLICDEYKAIVLMGASGTEAEEIDGNFRELFDAYKSLYKLATSPSGTVSSFADDYSAALDLFTSSDEALGIFLD